ncbi:MAG: Chemotaxis protein CheW [Firmicutes bacterium ADurb.Bin356]|nr:MAG: Chemotaxis protein CheW [Firmicutes bacterium ADurb.Bin356]
MANIQAAEQFNAEDEDTLRGKYLIFTVGKELYGMEIRNITEIIGIQPITAVPEMPEYVKGLTNLRGKVIPVMDARLRFQKEAKEYDDRTCIIVVESKKQTIGLIVDSVSEVLVVNDEDISPNPEITKTGHKYIKGIGKTGGSVKLLLDCERLVSDDILDESAPTA